MSLVGNLEDLSLGDIMQIISLSQKSGVLALECDGGSGRIVFRSGLVHAACLKGRPDDLRGLLVGGGWVEGSAFDGLAAQARGLGHSVEETIAREGGLCSERIDVLQREAVEAAILEMFSWGSGDFRFDVRSEPDPDDPQLVLKGGLNAQYLAMEGMRILDERSRDESGVSLDSDEAISSVVSSPSGEELFGDEPLETEAFLSGDEFDVVSSTAGDGSSAADVLVATVVSREDKHSTRMAAAETADEQGQQRGLKSGSVVPVASTRTTPAVLIDPDVSVLEWLKTAIQDDFARIHVFQQAEQGLARIRQYLIRGELPIVLISTRISIDPLSGIHGLSDFVERLKAQAARLVVVGLCDEDEDNRGSVPSSLDGVVARPGQEKLRENRESMTSESALKFASALELILARRITANEASAASVSSPKSASIRDLRDVTAELQAASSRGEILPVVLDFASGLFARVVILIVREEQVFAIAGRGIDTLEVDPLDSAPPVSLQVLDSGWIREVLQRGESVQGPPTTSADRELLARFGGAVPVEAYLGPIESGGSTVALLYGDQGRERGEMPDTSGLEVVLLHAGLALDRAALERALWEADAGST